MKALDSDNHYRFTIDVSAREPVDERYVQIICEMRCMTQGDKH